MSSSTKSLPNYFRIDYPGILKITAKDNPEGIPDKFIIGPIDSVLLTFHLVNNGHRNVFRFSDFGYTKYSFPQDSLNTNRVVLVGNPPRYYTIAFPAGREDSVHVNAIAEFCPNGFSDIFLNASDTSDHEGGLRGSIKYECTGSTGLKQGGHLPKVDPQFPRIAILRNRPTNSSLFEKVNGNWLYSPLGARIFLIDKKNVMSPEWEDLASGFYFMRRK